MPTTFKNASLKPLIRGFDVLYTVPAGANAIAMSALATGANGQAQSAAIGVAASGSGSINWLAQGINVPNGSSVNLLAGKVSLNAGDRLVANNATATFGSRLNAGGSHGYASEPITILSNTDGSIICAIHATGISTSTDGGSSSTLRHAEAFGATYRTGMFFGGAFWFYISATSARRSTDGVTWTTVAVTNAPTVKCTVFGSIVQKGGQSWGIRTGADQLTMTTDGTTWALQGVVLPVASCNGLAWTGTNWLVTTSVANGNVYLSTTAAAWTTVASGAGAVAANVAGIACVGGSVGAGFALQFRVSSDHGASWATSGISLYGDTPSILATSVALVAGTITANYLSVSQPGFPLVFYSSSEYIFHDALRYSSPFAIAGSRLISALGESSDLALTQRGGLTVTASVVEVS